MVPVKSPIVFINPRVKLRIVGPKFCDVGIERDDRLRQFFDVRSQRSEDRILEKQTDQCTDEGDDSDNRNPLCPGQSTESMWWQVLIFFLVRFAVLMPGRSKPG